MTHLIHLTWYESYALIIVGSYLLYQLVKGMSRLIDKCWPKKAPGYFITNLRGDK